MEPFQILSERAKTFIFARAGINESTQKKIKHTFFWVYELNAIRVKCTGVESWYLRSLGASLISSSNCSSTSVASCRVSEIWFLTLLAEAVSSGFSRPIRPSSPILAVASPDNVLKKDSHNFLFQIFIETFRSMDWVNNSSKNKRCQKKAKSFLNHIHIANMRN